MSRMQKVDIAIGVLGAVALLATGLGIALYDDINDLTHYHVTMAEDESFTNSGTVPADGLEWTFDAPQNAYTASGELTIDWSESTNPSLDGDVDVTVTVTGPDDSTVDTLTATFAYSDNSGVVDLDLSEWAAVPEDFDGDDEAVADRTADWGHPLTIEITIQGPSGQLPIADQDDPTYTADLAGNWHTYSIQADVPDPEAA